MHEQRAVTELRLLLPNLAAALTRPTQAGQAEPLPGRLPRCLVNARRLQTGGGRGVASWTTPPIRTRESAGCGQRLLPLALQRPLEE